MFWLWFLVTWTTFMSLLILNAATGLLVELRKVRIFFQFSRVVKC